MFRRFLLNTNLNKKCKKSVLIISYPVPVALLVNASKLLSFKKKLAAHTRIIMLIHMIRLLYMLTALSVVVGMSFSDYIIN